MHADPSLVTLREITASTLRSVIRLAVAESQKGFVAPNAVSLAQALFAPEAWYRAIYFQDEPVGFVMLEDESLLSPPPQSPKVGVWRFMIDARFQGRGYGRAALQKVIEHVRAKRVFDSLELSYVPGPGCPEPFYAALGFRPTGRVDEGEVVLELPLDHGGETEGGMPDVISDVTTEMLQAFADAWNRHDVDALMTFMTEDCVFEASAGPDICGIRYVGREAVRAAFAEVWATFPDAQWGNARHLVCGKRGVSEWTFTGTRADGTRVEVHGCDLFTFHDGRIFLKNSYRKSRPTQ